MSDHCQKRVQVLEAELEQTRAELRHSRVSEREVTRQRDQLLADRKITTALIQKTLDEVRKLAGRGK